MIARYTPGADFIDYEISPEEGKIAKQMVTIFTNLGTLLSDEMNEGQRMLKVRIRAEAKPSSFGLSVHDASIRAAYAQALTDATLERIAGSEAIQLTMATRILERLKKRYDSFQPNAICFYCGNFYGPPPALSPLLSPWSDDRCFHLDCQPWPFPRR